MYKAILMATLAVGVAAPLAAQTAAGAEFNPAISLTLMGQYSTRSGSDELELPGFQLGGEAGLADRGFSLDHSELTLSANIDPYFFGQMTIALDSHGDETSVELEEAFVETTALPAAMSLTFGRFLSAVGYLNSQHGHVQDFVDAPLPAQVFLGGSYYDDGLRLSWLAPTPLFLELGGEALRGGRFPTARGSSSELGAWSLFAHLGGDVGFNHSWQLGLSGLWAEPRQRRSDSHHHTHHVLHAGSIPSFQHEPDMDSHEVPAFTGSSNLALIDGVWKWAPDGNLAHRSMVLQAEYYSRREHGQLEAATPTGSGDYRGRQHGLYAQAVYRFRPRWRAGLRHDFVHSRNHGAPELLADAGLADADQTARRLSAMLDFAPSEFSRVRLQYSRSRLAGSYGNALFLQYIMSVGAHGAHRF